MPRIEHFSEVHEKNMGGIKVKHYVTLDGEMVFDDQQISSAYGVTREDIRAHFRRNKPSFGDSIRDYFRNYRSRPSRSAML